MNDGNEYSGFGSSQVPPFTATFGEPFAVTVSARRAGDEHGSF
jgi:hypothetical protein